MPALETWSLCILGPFLPQSQLEVRGLERPHRGDRARAAAQAGSVFTREVVTAIRCVTKHKHMRPSEPVT